MFDVGGEFLCVAVDGLLDMQNLTNIFNSSLNFPMALGQGIPEEWLSHSLEAHSKPKLENVDRAVFVAIVQGYHTLCIPKLLPTSLLSLWGHF